MDGAKQITDTIGLRKKCGRQAYGQIKSVFARIRESDCNENPGESRNRAV